MAKHTETIEVSSGHGFDTRLEVDATLNTPGETHMAAFDNVGDGNPCVIVRYSSGTERQRSGSRLPAMTPENARAFAKAIERAADAAEKLR